VERSAVRARSRLWVGFEGSEQWGKILVDVFDLDFDPVNEVVALETLPLKGIEFTRRPLVLDHEPDRLEFGTLR
jgi:hypothetical protein